MHIVTISMQFAASSMQSRLSNIVNIFWHRLGTTYATRSMIFISICAQLIVFHALFMAITILMYTFMLFYND
jgi:hypothetical protein